MASRRKHAHHLPDVIDEPATVEFGPQHQSTCGLIFNEPVSEGGKPFRPGRLARRRHRRRLFARQTVARAAGENAVGLPRAGPILSRLRENAHARNGHRPGG